MLGIGTLCQFFLCVAYSIFLQYCYVVVLCLSSSLAWSSCCGPGIFTRWHLSLKLRREADITLTNARLPHKGTVRRWSMPYMERIDKQHLPQTHYRIKILPTFKQILCKNFNLHDGLYTRLTWGFYSFYNWCSPNRDLCGSKHVLTNHVTSCVWKPSNYLFNY